MDPTLQINVNNGPPSELIQIEDFRARKSGQNSSKMKSTTNTNANVPSIPQSDDVDEDEAN